MLTVRVAVVLKVDGLNTIDATSTPAREARKWVIPARDSITIRGWQVSSRRARRFTFTDEGRSYASKLGRSGEFGTISATFFREREPVAYQSESDQERWAGSPLSAATGARGSDSVARSAAPLPHPANRAATGIGSSVAYTVRRISMDLESDPVARITLHYDFSHPWRHPDDRLSFSPEPPDDDPGPFCPEP